MDIFSRLRIAIALLVAIIIIGTAGYMLIAGYTLVDALFMTFTTISTVGYGIIKPLNLGGEIFTILLIIGGIGSALYTLSLLFEFVVEGHFTGYMRRRRMETRIAKLDDHYIICGFGRVGLQIAHEFLRSEIPFVVIDNNPEALERCIECGFIAIEGNASGDDALIKAGVQRCKGLIAASDSDPDNVFITLSARALNPQMLIIARASSDRVADKLRAAGADRVVSPYSMAGRRIAAMIARPLVTDYLDLASHSDQLEFQMEEIKVAESSPIAGASLREAGIRERFGVLVLAIHRKSGETLTNPKSSTVFENGDSLIVIGTQDQLKLLSQKI